MFEFFIYLVIATVVMAALAPKPQTPKPADISDFDAPTAEEGRAIPVVFGTVLLSGPNILWYGDLRTTPIQVESGGLFSKKTTVGYWYYMGVHFGLAHGPVDQLLQIQVGEREAWSGTVSASGSIYIDKLTLFGGEKEEGGIQGSLDICMGEAAQVANTYLVSKLGSTMPAYRGLFAAVWKGGKLSALNPYIKPWAFKVKRVQQGWNGTVWYAAKIDISGDMNPAHIVYQCLTDSVWGMGYGASSIDTASFQAAADTLYTEGFGLSMTWARSTTIESFLKIVMDHIGGILYVKPTTGAFAIKLLRADYTKSALPLYGPSNLVAATDYERQAWGETVNEISVTYRDKSTNKDATITVQDLANITNQGAVVNQSKNYSGISTAAIAQRVAMRDLLSSSTPLARVKLTANRTAWSAYPGDVIRLNWPAFGVEDVVFRILEIKQGTLQDGTITIQAIEDVFGLPTSTYVGNQSGLWTNPQTSPASATYRRLIEEPYWDAARRLSSSDLAALSATTSFVQTLAARPSSDSIDYDVYTKLSSGSTYNNVDTGTFAPTATLVGNITPTTTSLTFAGGIDTDIVAPGGYIIIDNEYLYLSTINTTTSTLTVSRGVLDTVPANHSDGARIWFAQDNTGVDGTARTSGTVNVKMLPRTGLGSLAEAAAPADSITIANRQGKPYPPGNFKLNGASYPTSITGQLVVTWSHRDRTQGLGSFTSQSTGDIGPEAGTTYTVRLYDQNNVLRKTVTGITTTTYTWTTESADSGLSGGALNTSVRATVASVVSGRESTYAQDWTTTRT